MFIALGGMVIFLLQREWVGFFVISAISAALGWLSALYLLEQMNRQAELTRRQRRKEKKRRDELWRVAVVWIGLLVSTVGIAVTIIEGPQPAGQLVSNPLLQRYVLAVTPPAPLWQKWTPARVSRCGS